MGGPPGEVLSVAEIGTMKTIGALTGKRYFFNKQIAVGIICYREARQNRRIAV
jgi:hypothetical protein